jgi:predicted N-formylglutamate amidohydrolase
MSNRAYECIGTSARPGPFLFTCEHASNALPDGIEPSLVDRKLLDEHWGWDIGARDVVVQLVARLGGEAVASKFSRLWVDPNRASDSESLIVKEIDGEQVSFNSAVDPDERANRLRNWYEPYHDAVTRVGLKQAAVSTRPLEILSVHSFTPLYLGKSRPMEIGVLFNEYDERAWHMEEALNAQGFEVALNAPYSGKPPERLIYAAQRHGELLEVPYLELEIRQDLIEKPSLAEEVGNRIATGLLTYLELCAVREP